MTALKWAGKSRDLIEGLLAPYGGPAFLAGKDFDGEFFSPNTDFSLSWFKDWERPLLYQHGLDSAIKTDVVGRIKVEQTDAGLWMQAQLDKSSQYYDAIASLVDKKALGLSSGSVSHLVEKDLKSGEIKAWPLIEGSMTPTPANPDASLGYSMKSAEAVAHLAVIGTDIPEAVKVTEMIEETLDTETSADPTDATVSIKVVADTTEALAIVEAVKASFTPQALHDAAVASGAACKSSETHEPEPAPLLAIAGKSVETANVVDLDAYKAKFSEIAIATAKELLDS